MGKDLEQPGTESGEHGEDKQPEKESTGSKQVLSTKPEQTKTEPTANGQTATGLAATGQCETELAAIEQAGTEPEASELTENEPEVAELMEGDPESSETRESEPEASGLTESEPKVAEPMEGDPESSEATESEPESSGLTENEPDGSVPSETEPEQTGTGSAGNALEQHASIKQSSEQAYAVSEDAPTVHNNPPTADNDAKTVSVLARSSKPWIKRNKAILIAACVLILITAFTGIALGVYTRDNGIIAPGIKISDVPVGNLTKEQASTKLDTKIKQTLDQTIKFSADGKIIEVKAGELGLNLTATAALEQAYAIGRQGSSFQKATEKRRASQGLSFSLKTNWDDKKLTDTLQKSVGKFNQPAKDASFTINDQNQMDIKDSQVGKIIDVSVLAAELKAQDIFAPKEIKVVFKEDLPKLTKATLESQRITGQVSSFSTHFNAAQTNRVENLRVAARSLDKVVIKPGETFSFNQVVGPRSDEAGYKNATVIVGGEFVPGLGGGVCQVSTTLYNALLLADVAIVERSNHSLSVAYVPLGQDATVAYPGLDLKFKNDTGAYLLIRSRVQGDMITFDLYGQPKPNRQVIITNTTQQVINPSVQRVLDRSLPPGAEVVKQAGQPGYVVATTKVVKVNGEVVKTQSLGTSRYQSSPKIIATGP